jgi:DNA invertase Pin-like site-specific DNA recombinase
MMACYCRVSSRSQKTDSQKAEITRWLQQQGVALTAVQWFEDVERGHTLRRPAFARLQHAIDTGAITTVMVWKLDRLARRQQDGINFLADWCARNVRVVAVTQQIDLERFSFGCMAYVNAKRLPVKENRNGSHTSGWEPL